MNILYVDFNCKIKIFMNTAETTTTSWEYSVIDNPVGAFIVKIIWGVLLIVFLFLLAKLVSSLIKKSIIRHTKSISDDGAIKIWNLIGSISFYVLILFAIFVGFEVMGLEISLLISWISLWLWLAFKDVLGNMFAWIMILYTKEFKIWDVIEVDLSDHYFGRIEEITVRYTTLRTLDLRQVVIPNITLISTPIRTFSSEELVRLNTVIQVHYDSDLSKVIEVLKESINSINFVKNKENTKVFVTNFGENGIDIKCLFFFDPNDWLIGEVAIGLVNEKIGKVFDENKIRIPYPHTTLTFENKEQTQKILDKVSENI